MKICDHLRAAEKHLEKADLRLTPDHSLRNAVAPPIHFALIYIGLALVRASAFGKPSAITAPKGVAAPEKRAPSRRLHD